MFPQYRRYSPVGEYLRLVIMKRLYQGPAAVEEVNELAKRAVEALGVRYDWRAWPKLLEREVAVKGGVAELTSEGRFVYEETREAVEEWLRRLGLPPP